MKPLAILKYYQACVFTSFLDTVSPEKAGMPGSGPWVLYGGPRPFTGYTIYQRPKDANQMCALVANANHSIIFESGNCVDLPES